MPDVWSWVRIIIYLTTYDADGRRTDTPLIDVKRPLIGGLSSIRLAYDDPFTGDQIGLLLTDAKALDLRVEVEPAEAPPDDE